MVVDDDPALTALLTVWLRDNCQVILAADGYQAVQLAVTERPDVILLGRGFSVHDRLRNLSGVASTPFAFTLATALAISRLAEPS